MPKITASVTERDKSKLNHLISEGYYSTASEVVRAGLRNLKTPKRASVDNLGGNQ